MLVCVAVSLTDICMPEFARISDVQSQKQMISRKIRIQDFLGDKSVRDDTVKMYRQLQRGVTQ